MVPVSYWYRLDAQTCRYTRLTLYTVHTIRSENLNFVRNSPRQKQHGDVRAANAAACRVSSTRVVAYRLGRQPIFAVYIFCGPYPSQYVIVYITDISMLYSWLLLFFYTNCRINIHVYIMYIIRNDNFPF